MHQSAFLEIFTKCFRERFLKCVQTIEDPEGIRAHYLNNAKSSQQIFVVCFQKTNFQINRGSIRKYICDNTKNFPRHFYLINKPKELQGHRTLSFTGAFFAKKKTATTQFRNVQATTQTIFTETLSCKTPIHSGKTNSVVTPCESSVSGQKLRVWRSKFVFRLRRATKNASRQFKICVSPAQNSRSDCFPCAGPHKMRLPADLGRTAGPYKTRLRRSTFAFRLRRATRSDDKEAIRLSSEIWILQKLLRFSMDVDINIHIYIWVYPYTLT